jgi:dTDP-glucose 4,6-dehydratase
MNTWLITGGAGFIGSNFVRMLGKTPPARLLIFDALTYAGNLASIADLIDDDAIRFIRGDLCDPSTVNVVFAKHDIERVIHFAAESHVDRSILGPRAFVETNVNGTMNLLTAARERWQGAPGNQLFLHVSTDEVYGTLSSSDPPFAETTAYAPNSPYAASKAAADHLVRAWHHTYGLPTIITNCSNNYGPWQFPEKLIPLMILHAIEGVELPVYGDGMQVRDWLHVQDHCEA